MAQMPTPIIQIPSLNTPVATDDSQGDMSAADKAKLDALPTGAALTISLAAKEDTADKGAASGYAPLDSGSKVPVVNLPAASAIAAGTESAAHYSSVAALGTMSTQAASAVAITGGTATNLALTTPTIDGEPSSATKQDRLTAMAAEFGAGARGMQLIETWAPLVSTNTHTFNVVGSNWRELVLTIDNIGNGSLSQFIVLKVDGADTGAYTRRWTAGTLWEAAVPLTTGAGETSSLVVTMRRVGTNLWQWFSVASATVLASEIYSGKMITPVANIVLLDAGGANFVGSQTVAKLYGVADEVSADVPSVGVFGASPVTYTLPYTDNIFKVASTTTSKSLVTLNARQRLCGVAIDPQTAFAGTGITTVTCSLGSATGGNEAIYLTALNAMQTDGGRASGGLYLAKDLAVPDTNREIVIHLTANVNFGDGGATVLTAGKVWVTLYTATLPDGT